MILQQCFPASFSFFGVTFQTKLYFSNQILNTFFTCSKQKHYFCSVCGRKFSTASVLFFPLRAQPLPSTNQLVIKQTNQQTNKKTELSGPSFMGLVLLRVVPAYSIVVPLSCRYCLNLRKFSI